MEAREILEQMTTADKIRLCTGGSFWRSRAMACYGIPAFTMADGPHGLRCQRAGADMLGVHNSLPATCFPSAVTAAAAWNPDLSAAIGAAIGREALAAGVDLVLGPGCNIKRNPLCGRNFEYLSEDPYLSGKLAAAFIRGQQGAGASSCVKHFAANNQEYKRQNGDSQVDQRALREIYLAPFELAVREGRPDAVMCAYNKLNGVHCSDSRWLLTDVLRREWGFDGMVVTDWGGLNDRIAAFQAGCDLSMPGGSHFMEKSAGEAVRVGTLPREAVDASAERVLRLALRRAKGRKSRGAFSRGDHHDLARRAAEQGAVLLKNQDHILPALAEDMVLIGYMAEHFRCQGSGSSHINPTRLTSLRSALPEVPYFPCCDRAGQVTEAGLRRAARLAGRARVAVVAAGLPDSWESEGFDRESLAMPEGHRRMIEAVAGANPNTVVVLLGGGPMELPWLDRVKAVLYMGLSGQAGGEACANLLTGRANPCGKLAETWPVRYGDVISRETFGQQKAEYRESLYVGYRYYDKAKKAVAFPFGHGLSCTRFAYSGLEIKGESVSLTVANTGGRAGAEVVQLYLAPPQDGLHRPLRELKGFRRVELAAGEEARISFPLDRRSFAVWADGWRVPGGRYGVLVGSSSRDIRLEGRLEVAGERLPVPSWQAGSWYETMEGAPTRQAWEKAMGRMVFLLPPPRRGRFTLDNTCLEMRGESLVMELQYQITKGALTLLAGGRRDPEDLSYKMMLSCAVDCPLRSVVINTGGRIPERLVRGLLEAANGRWLGSVRALLKP